MIATGCEGGGGENSAGTGNRTQDLLNELRTANKRTSSKYSKPEYSGWERFPIGLTNARGLLNKGVESAWRFRRTIWPCCFVNFPVMTLIGQYTSVVGSWYSFWRVWLKQRKALAVKGL